MDTLRHQEGRTRLVVPAESLTGVPPPTSPVFFNPAASLNRDVTVSVTSVVRGSTFCDAMSGVGARGIRVAREVERIGRVDMVDFNKDALALSRRSAALNRVLRKCRFTHSETSSYLYSRFGADMRFDFVDVDPFGSPMRQVQAALAATRDGGILSVTATDTAVLCGVYPEVCWRRYGSVPINNAFHHETGLRILAAAVARQAGPMDLGVEPMVAHSTRHYARLYLKVGAGAAKAGRTLSRLGFVTWCPGCGHSASGAAPETVCAKCGKKSKTAGPLWLGKLVDDEVASASAIAAEKTGFTTASRLLRALIGVDGFPPWSYDLEKVCSLLGIPSVSESSVRSRLEGSGRRTLRQPFEHRGVKTDADEREVAEAVLESYRAKERPLGGRVGSFV